MTWLPLPDFQPHPWLRSGHAQTIAGAYWPVSLNSESEPVQHSISLDDGDRLILFDDQPKGWSSKGPAVLLIHGLGGEVRKGPTERLAVHLTQRGQRVFRMEMRGVGAGMYEARGWTHAGRSEDVAATIRFIEKLAPRSPLKVVGFSMGGNQLLKMLGEMGAHPSVQLTGAIAVAPPVCLQSCSRSISKGLNRLYDWNFLKTMQRQLRARRQVPGLHVRKVVPFPSRLREFDRQFTAPINGFASVDDYYDRSSSRHLLSEIRVPTLILAADDDPVVPVHSYDQLNVSPEVHLQVTRGGGHLGYVSSSGADPDARWLDWRLIEQLTGEQQSSGDQESPS